MIYLPQADSQGKPPREELGSLFGENKVYPLSGDGAFVVKMPNGTSFYDIMDKIGFNEARKRLGLVIEVDNTNLNGWYSNKLWDFVSDKIDGGDDAS